MKNLSEYALVFVLLISVVINIFLGISLFNLMKSNNSNNYNENLGVDSRCDSPKGFVIDFVSEIDVFPLRDRLSTLFSNSSYGK